MNAFDQWELDAKLFRDGTYVDFSKRALCYRITVLIDLIRKKDEALSFYAGGAAFYCHPQMDIKGPAKIALALTEQLK